MLTKSKNRLTLIGMSLWMLLQFGCASHGVIANAPLALPGSHEPYSIESGINTMGSAEISFLLSFSGGGTRAAALSYGVLEALRDTTVDMGGKSVRMIDEIDISALFQGAASPLPIMGCMAMPFSMISRKFF